MGFRLSWLLENRIIYVTYEGVFTKDDLQRYLVDSLEMRDRANAALGEYGLFVHTITDARTLTKNDIPLPEALKMLNTLRQQRVGWSIYIPANKMDMFFASMGHQIAKVRYRNASSITDAVRFLKEVDPSLADFTYTEPEKTASTGSAG